MEDWRPIETAPRDGTLLLVAYPESYGHRRYRLAYWATGSWGAVTEGWSDQWRQLRSTDPGYWMPIPAPPPAG